MVRRCLPALPLLLLPAQALAQDIVPPPPPPPVSEAPGSGGDLTRPNQRIDLRVEFNEREDAGETVFTLRHDRPVAIGGGWRINFRVDFPFVRNAEVTPDNPLGREDDGFGDILVQAVFAHHDGPDRGFGIGAQVILPTASQQGYGKGKWRLRPTAGYRWSLPAISEGSFFQLLARYDVSIAGDDDRDGVSVLMLSPNLELGLPGDAYLSIFPSADIRYDFNHHEFFLPVNLEIGKEFGPVVASLEGAAGLISGDHPPYDWKLEFRLGLRF